jgi:Fe-S-cluster containining protein
MRIQLKPYDIAKLPKSYKKRLTKYEGGWTALKAVKRNGKYRCPALRGRVGKDTRCAIYKNRPFNCKYFEMDAELCRMARFEYGMPLRGKMKFEEAKG